MLFRSLAPLAQLITMAAGDSQIIVVSHSRALVDALGRAARNGGAEVNAIELAKEFGETGVVGQEALDQPAWHWPKRLRLAALAVVVRDEHVGDGQGAEEQPAGYQGRGGR